jgi:hypothetical protein
MPDEGFDIKMVQGPIKTKHPHIVGKHKHQKSIPHLLLWPKSSMPKYYESDCSARRELFGNRTSFTPEEVMQIAERFLEQRDAYMTELHRRMKIAQYIKRKFLHEDIEMTSDEVEKEWGHNGKDIRTI